MNPFNNPHLHKIISAIIDAVEADAFDPAHPITVAAESSKGPFTLSITAGWAEASRLTGLDIEADFEQMLTGGKQKPN